jgi:GNAT superfamily N-acetyltransferase
VNGPSSSFHLESVGWDDPRAIELRRLMDVELTARYSRPDDAPQTATLIADRNAALAVGPADVRATVLAIGADGTPLAHAALRALREDWEVKRVVVDAAARGRGVGVALMTHLEAIARQADRPRLILQTGDRQPDAVALYLKLGYIPIPIYEPYVATMPFSMCFEKLLP